LILHFVSAVAMTEFQMRKLRALISSVREAEQAVAKGAAESTRARLALKASEAKAAAAVGPRDSAAAELDKLGKPRAAILADLEKARAALQAAEHASATHLARMAEMRKRCEELLTASEISPEVHAALTSLDRRQLSEISKLGTPPATVKSALEVVWVFIDLFATDASAANAAAAPESSAQKLQAKLKGRPWADTRKHFAVDLRPMIITIEPDNVAKEENSLALEGLRKAMEAIDGKKVAKASKPTGVLFAWCSAVLSCALSIRERTVIEVQLQQMEADTEKVKLAPAAAVGRNSAAR